VTYLLLIAAALRELTTREPQCIAALATGALAGALMIRHRILRPAQIRRTRTRHVAREPAA